MIVQRKWRTYKKVPGKSRTDRVQDGRMAHQEKNASVREKKIMTGKLIVNLTGQSYLITFLNNTSMDWSDWNTLWWTCIFIGIICVCVCVCVCVCIWLHRALFVAHGIFCYGTQAQKFPRTGLFALRHMGCGILFSLPGTELAPPALHGWLLTTRPLGSSLFVGIFKVLTLWISLPWTTDLFAVSSPPQLKTSSLLRPFSV